MSFHADEYGASAKRALDIIQTVTERGRTYGHPLDDHGRAAAIIRAVFGERPITTPEDVQLVMICVKLARLGETPDHDDSWLDIAGYVECRFKTIEERERRS
jgi:hypothetical protein